MTEKAFASQTIAKSFSATPPLPLGEGWGGGSKGTSCDHTLFIRVAAFLPRSTVNGPGQRSVLWVQGCPFHCPGCCNLDFRPFAGGTPHEAAEIARWILEVPDSEGVTFSGGEPFSQVEGLAEVARLVQRSGKSVVIFTGHRYQDLLAVRDNAWASLLDQADLLIAGPYEAANPSPHPLLASANQELVCLTERYRDYAHSGGKRMEFKIGPDGTMVATGLMPAVATGIGL